MKSIKVRKTFERDSTIDEIVEWVKTHIEVDDDILKLKYRHVLSVMKTESRSMWSPGNPTRVETTFNHEATKPRFAKYFTEGPINDCWGWKGGKSANGYGKFTIGRRGYQAHRISYILYVGDTTGKYVCHKCDNRICINPHHLFLGTHDDNMRDMGIKGRKTTKISLVQRQALLDAIGAKHRIKDIAQYFKVDPSTVHYLRINYYV